MESPPSLHIVMTPWFAFGHITPYLHLSNKLAQKGHKISFVIPTRTRSKFNHLNQFPDLISFYPITVAHVDGLPFVAETTNDVPSSLIPLIMAAMDRTQNDIELLLRHLKPDMVFFDRFSSLDYQVGSRLGPSLYYSTTTPVTMAYILSSDRNLITGGHLFSETDLMVPPPSYPDPLINLHLHEARALYEDIATKLNGDILFFERWYMGLTQCDAVGFKACREIDGPFLDYLQKSLEKPFLVSGPLIPDPPVSSLEQKWVDFLGGFQPGSVVYCALGSEATLEKDQFQELLLGLELSGLPFLAALRNPFGVDSIDEALPLGFGERIKERGAVHEGWIQQQKILEHPSVVCFVTHCGWGSLLEGLVSPCELVMLPRAGDQIFNARLMGKILKVGVEVQKGEKDGLFSKESVCKAIRTLMDDDSEVGREIRINRAKLRDVLLRKDLESS
ncbi:LOW QUALITY PROTEIN: UDP-glucuronosyl/UDP-glucosyltransferase [Trema orientale]|uniref:UDP-glucuronosyl/UDP-glucosyltransferase n=1 Tax=Trema orientale TaxID=63057 RepID=A0A2P5E7R2_TREOI|nr:LOW QUALITY PROTEIN: UDP-glucuronosyl/UDP-glucosyltransferase [Trema orientale]